MALFTDTITLYHKVSETEWRSNVVKGVQWSEKTDKQNNNGKISIVKYISVTFPEGTYEDLFLDLCNEEDCIVYGVVEDVVKDEKGYRISDLMKRYPRSGLIQSVNDNSNRDILKNIKVVLA